MATPPFWTPAMEDKYRNTQVCLDLLNTNHQAVLHSRDGGWKMPIYVCFNWLARLSKTYATLVWRRQPQLSADPTSQQKVIETIIKDVKFQKLAKKAQIRVSATGEANLKLRKSERFNKPVLRLWGTNAGEFTWWENDPGEDPYAVSFYREEVGKYKGSDAVFRVRERFELAPNSTHILVTNSAKLREQSADEKAAFIPLYEIYPNNPPPDEAILKMPCLPAHRVQNGDDSETDYKPDLLNLQKSLTSSMTTYTIAVIMSTMPQVRVPARYCKPDGSVDLSLLMVTIYDERTPDEDLITMSLAGNDFNLENVDRYLDRLDHAYYQLTGMSPAIDGEADGAGATSGYARRLGLLKPECHIEERREAWDDFWTWLGVAVPAIAITEPKPNHDYGTPLANVTATWDAAIPADQEEESQSVQRGVQGGYISREQAVRRENPEMTEEQVQAELALIVQEQADATARQLASFAGMPAG